MLMVRKVASALFFPGFLFIASGCVGALVLLGSVLWFGTVPPSSIDQTVRLVLLGVVLVAPACLLGAELSPIEE